MTEMNPVDRRLEEAMDWLLRARERPDDAALRAEVEAWVAANPDHRRAWDQARRAWQVMGDAEPASAADRTTRKARVPATPTHRMRRETHATGARARGRSWRGRAAIASAGLAAAVLLALLFDPSVMLRMQADHVTAAAETRQIALTDGSVVHLAPKSAIDLQFTDERRAVTLLAGDAFFEVVPDARRPFVVDTDDLSARVVGTTFGVGTTATSVDVEVASGAVRVTSDATRPDTDLRLGRGDTLRLNREAKSARLGQRPPGDMAAWRQGFLLVADASVAEIVDTLRRYRTGWIVIADDRLAAQRVNGVYDLRDPDGALRALVQPVGGTVHHVSPLLRVLR